MATSLQSDIFSLQIKIKVKHFIPKPASLSKNTSHLFAKEVNLSNCSTDKGRLRKRARLQSFLLIQNREIFNQAVSKNEDHLYIS